jgi:hypothetical protein
MFRSQTLRRWILSALVVVAAMSLIGCGVSVSLDPPGGGLQVTGGIFGLRFTFTIGGAPIDTQPNVPAEAAVGYRLFEEPPPATPPSATMTLPSSEVGVAQRLAKGLQGATALPLFGSGTIVFRIASGTDADLCDSAVLLAQYDFVYTSGVASILNEEYEISQQALDIVVTNDVTICIEITVDFAASITIGDFILAFGGTPGTGGGAQTADFRLSNDDTFQNIHILLPGQNFPDNRLTPGSAVSDSLEVEAGDEVTVRAGRNGSIIDTATCPAVIGGNYSARGFLERFLRELYRDAGCSRWRPG